jgi:hypothetical protein
MTPKPRTQPRTGRATGSDERFRYEGYELDLEGGTLVCRYAAGNRTFVERIGFPASASADPAAGEAAARLVYLMAGVSYYKTTAAPVVDLGPDPTSGTERNFLAAFYRHGMAEFAYRNGIDLAGLTFEGAAGERLPAAGAAGSGSPLVPFGGGMDSIVTVECVKHSVPGAELFIVNRHGDRFAAIEAAARQTGLPVVRFERDIDPQVLRSAELGLLNGHVPVTGIISALAVMAGVLSGRDAVVMSNEASASAGNLVVGGEEINHQYSKSLAFESDFRALLEVTFDAAPQYFSLLRPFSELWVARRFATLGAYHRRFHSCNRAFHIDPARRMASWCGQCDKCCFIDLVLAPFMPEAELAAIFDGAEPLSDPALLPRFRTLVGASQDAKPFECVGDVDECRAAARAAAGRPDRARSPVLASLARELPAGAPGDDPLVSLLRPHGPHFIPPAYAPDALVG